MKITTKDCLLLLIEEECNPDILFHSLHVARKSFEIAKKIDIKNNVTVDLDLVFHGGLLHDIGRCRTHDIDHGIMGAKIIIEHLNHDKLANIAARHIGGGIPKKEAKELGLPEQDFLPTTLEEKIVCYADKLFQYEFDKHHRILSWEETDTAEKELTRMENKLGIDHPAITRLREIEKEIMSYY